MYYYSTQKKEFKSEHLAILPDKPSANDALTQQRSFFVISLTRSVSNPHLPLPDLRLFATPVFAVVFLLSLLLYQRCYFSNRNTRSTVRAKMPSIRCVIILPCSLTRIFLPRKLSFSFAFGRFVWLCSF